MSHTPGPWSYVIEHEGLPEHGEQGDGCRYLYDADRNALMAGVRYYPWTPDNEDDWRLIAAAPDLLAALKVFVVNVDDTDWNGIDEGMRERFVRVADFGRAAIAKTEGK